VIHVKPQNSCLAQVPMFAPQPNELRAVVRAAGLLLLALSILNFAPFAYSQERGIVGTIDNPAGWTAFSFDLHRASSAGFEKKDRRNDQKQPHSLGPRRPLPQNGNG
jgi:hypothetical protein